MGLGVNSEPQFLVAGEAPPHIGNVFEGVPIKISEGLDAKMSGDLYLGGVSAAEIGARSKKDDDVSPRGGGTSVWDGRQEEAGYVPERDTFLESGYLP